MDDDVKEWIRSELRGVHQRIDALSRQQDETNRKFWGVVIAGAFGAGKIAIDFLKGNNQ